MLTQQMKPELRNAPVIIGRSQAVFDMMKFVYQAADATDIIFIRGETGVGKDLLAECIHAKGMSGGEFVTVNCGAIPESLCETELFGHISGAFTDARSTKMGLIQVAEGGTLFLSEVANMSHFLQAKFLDVFDKKNFRPVGGTKTIPMNARIIAATNEDMEQAVREGKIRRDLYYRLNVIPYFIPPLRERREDISDLAVHFLNGQRENVTFSREAMEAMEDYPWPGNIRELQLVVKRTLFFIGGSKKIIEIEDIKSFLMGVRNCDNNNIQKQWAKHFPTYREMKAWYFQELVKKTNGNMVEAAALSGLTRGTVTANFKKF